MDPSDHGEKVRSVRVRFRLRLKALCAVATQKNGPGENPILTLPINSVI